MRHLPLLLIGLFALVSSSHAVDPAAPPKTLDISLELPDVLRDVAGGGKRSPVTHADIAVAWPAGFDPAKRWPVLVVSATSDPGFNSSRALMGKYAEVATAAGWVVIAADAQGDLPPRADTLQMRIALVSAALGALEIKWPGAGQSDLAFAGFSGGAKHSGWLAAAFSAQGRRVIGVFQAGINEETVAKAARRFKVDENAFSSTHVFLVSGSEDQMATPEAHRRISKQLKREGFTNVTLHVTDGAHAVDPQPLKLALEAFSEDAKR
jgi:predicted esterase